MVKEPYIGNRFPIAPFRQKTETLFRQGGDDKSFQKLVKMNFYDMTNQALQKFVEFLRPRIADSPASNLCVWGLEYKYSGIENRRFSNVPKFKEF
jgi:hypothetical protein